MSSETLTNLGFYFVSHMNNMQNEIWHKKFAKRNLAYFLAAKLPKYMFKMFMQYTLSVSMKKNSLNAARD